MEKRVIPARDGAMGYILYLPKGGAAGLPLMVYLHGAGERGTALDHVTRHGLCRLMEEGREVDAAVLCPQCPVDVVWDNITREVKALIDDIAAELGSDLSRITLTGSSMGGYGTWAMGLNYNAFFAGIAPVAGGGMSWRCRNLAKMPVYALHGAQDSVVPAACSVIMAEAVNSEGGHAELTLLDGFDHDDGIWKAYKDCGIVEWLLARRRTDFEPMPDVCSEYY